MRFYCYILLFMVVIVSCKQSDTTPANTTAGKSVPVLYAKGFTITQYDGYKIVIVRDPLDTNKIIQQYRLITDKQFAGNNSNEINIQVPLHDIASLSTTHLGFFEALGVADKLIAFSGTKYIYSDLFTTLVSSGKIQEVGVEGGIDLELLVSLQPDIIMSYQTGDESYDHFEKMKSMQLQPVINNEYLELTPLGQAEWIKFIAAFFNLEEKATTIFDSIATNYNSIKKQAAGANTKPTVFTGLAYKNEWTIPGGKSFAANFIKDAGATYLWETDDKTGNFALSFEEIFTTAQHADFWLNVSTATLLKEILSIDKRYTYFDPFKNKTIYNNYARVNQMGGNDYWESAIVYPDKVLNDLVQIFHPELKSGDNYFYYIHLQ